MSATVTAATDRPGDGLASQIAYLARVLKTPTIAACWEQLAAQARDQNWSHEEYLAALRGRRVAAASPPAPPCASAPPTSRR